MAGPVVASLEDCLVREEDLALLQPGNWLNDQIVGFYFELCQHRKFAGQGIAFVGPEVTQFAKVAAAEEVAVCLGPLELDNKAAVMWAVNNSRELDTPGGSHWSLLVFSRRELAFYHLDSSAGMNRGEAAALAARVQRVVGAPRAGVAEVEVAQQTNGSDCGVHLLLAAAACAEHLGAGGGVASLPPLGRAQVEGGRRGIDKEIKAVGCGAVIIYM